MEKWRKRATVEDLKTGPKEPRSTVLIEAEVAIVVASPRASIDEALLHEALREELFAGTFCQALHLLSMVPSHTTSSNISAETSLEMYAANRVSIEAVSTEINCGRFPAKSTAGHPFPVEADIFCDGHDVIAAALLFRPAGTHAWTEESMQHIDNDRWRGVATFPENRPYEYTIVAWRDLFATWRRDVAKKHAAGQSVSQDMEEGYLLINGAFYSLPKRSKTKQSQLRNILEALSNADEDERLSVLMSADTAITLRRFDPRIHCTQYERILKVTVDRPLAAFSAWYEMMPRSQSDDPERHGTFEDVIRKLPYVRDMGFNVLYFPPIHPIGRTNRKGRNNSLTAKPEDPGSPYAIGSGEGGHDAIHPELGSLEDFRKLVKAAKAEGLEIAFDFAINCSPDHPWIRDHPEWFDWRPDGTIKYAENPPKKYEDIVNVHFYRDALPGVWLALRDVVLFWIEQGVTLFRVDNPHTKPFPFWEWLISEVQERHPQVIFLAEAFTRPKPMKRLAKLGFTQSYSYFTWRNEKQELTDYLTELTTTECVHYMRPNFFVNTPDINPYFLQTSGRPGFQVRLVLAATLGGNYGIYSGFELCEAEPIPGKEEYLNSEKYEIRAWDRDTPRHIRDDIRLINDVRHKHPALQEFANLHFYNCWNDHILYYGKRTADLSSFLLFAVNLDPHNSQSGQFEVPLWEFGLPDEGSLDVEDMVTGERFTWQGKTQHLWLDPNIRPYAVWRLLQPGTEA